MANQTIFKRYEYKYLLTADQKKNLQAYMETYMKPDTFGRNTICNLYFDTPDYLLIRRSIEGKVYKEKIRLRTYGRAQDDSEAFIELKKKLKDGTFTIDFCDDSLHTNGNLSICGGTYTLSTGDDGMHADGADQVYGGEITIKTCYESKDRIWKAPVEPSISQPAIMEMVLWITMERRRSPGERW